jgi:hypothetical protein
VKQAYSSRTHGVFVVVVVAAAVISSFVCYRRDAQ